MKSKALAHHPAWHIIAAFCFSLVLTACDTAPPQPALRIASSVWPGYEPLYLARDLGYFDTTKVSLFELPSADITMEAFRNHSTDLATVTLDATLELIHDGTPLRILQIMDISHGGDAVMAAPHIKSLADLKGTRISIVNIPLGLYMLSRLLDKASLNRADVEVFPMSDSKQVSFYEQGNVDAVITFDPIKTHLAAKGMHVLFDSSDIPNEIFDILVVHEDIYQARRQELCDVVKQWHRTLDYMHTNKQDAARRISARLAINIEDYDAVMSGLILPSASDNQRLLGGEHPEILGAANTLSRIMFKEQQLSRLIDISPALDTTFTRCYAK
ncbi:ABC transporter substrate-binding protein [Sulfuriflexus mobilis]|uniref:ABC transporter substrate-binding protein n=1 Tax=Sulfuriflexus mobilis TaxID=1811807 RepID=UPI000F828F63|nr:ABC transporter substrate-binding protein [Sulfuriflexus mobilis]